MAKDTKKETITNEELESLRKAIQRQREIKVKQAEICLSKEVQLRQIKESFDENWQVLQLQGKSADKQSQELIKSLSDKYGSDKSFDLDTGEIKIIESNE